MKPSICGRIVICLAVVCSVVSANEWTGAIGSRWDEPGNWSQGLVPLGAWQSPDAGWDDPLCPCYPLTPNTNDDGPLDNNNAQLRYQGIPYPNMNEPTTISIDGTTEHPMFGTGIATAYGVRVGNGGGDVTMHIDGGRLEIGGVNPSSPGGNRNGWHFDIGRGWETHNPNPAPGQESKQRVIMTGGEVETNGLLIPEQFIDETVNPPNLDTPSLNGELIMSGGTITGRWMNLGQLLGNGNVEMSGDAVINLYPTQPTDRNNGGHFSFNRNWFLAGQPVPSNGNATLDLSGNATINIFGHADEFQNTPNQEEVDRYQGYIDDAHDPLSKQALTANGGTADPIITLQPCPEAPDPLAELCVNSGGMMITITAPQTGIPGDYDGDGLVSAGDLNLVLNNWGQNGEPAPAGWVNDLPAGVISAEELNGVLNAWGNTAPLAVPEPAGLMLASLALLLFWRRR